jgi:hypothetical protein
MVGSATTLDASIARFVTDRNIFGKRKSGPLSDRHKEAKGGETQGVGDARRLPPIRRIGEKGQVHISGRGLFHSNGLFCCYPQLHSQRQIALIALVDCDGIDPTSS